MSALFLPNLHEKIPALFLLPACWNTYSHPAHCMEESLLFSCSLLEEISALIMLTVWRNALFLLTAWRNTCSHPAHCMEECLLSSCSLNGEIPSHFLLTLWKFALFLLTLNGEIPAALSLHTVQRNPCSQLAHCMEESLLSSWSLHGPALILLSVYRNVCSLPAHWMEKYLLSSCSLYGGMSALFLLTEWRNICSHPAYCTEECLLPSYSLHGEIPALILLTDVDLCSLPAYYMEKYLLSTSSSHPAHSTKKSLLSPCSLYGGTLLSPCHPAHCMEESLLSPCSQHGRIPAFTLVTVGKNSALTLLTVWRNPCSHPARCLEECPLSSCPPCMEKNSKTFSHSAHFTEVFLLSPCTQYGEIPALTLLTLWRNSALTLSPCSLYGGTLLSPCSLYGGIPALTLLAVWRNPCSHPARCMEESLNHFNQLKRAGAQQGFLFSYFKKMTFPLFGLVSVEWASCEQCNDPKFTG